MSIVAEPRSLTSRQSDIGTADDTLIKFYKAYPHAIPVMRAERSALGTIPAKAYKYCEALCSASAFGWYVFPPTDIRLFFDGVDVYVDLENEWCKLTSMHLPDVDNWWDSHCPEELRGMAPPFLTDLGLPGYVQIWSGMLVSTRPDWSILVRPLANIQQTRQFFCFEGLLETDRYSPAPLFTNIKLQTTGVPIEIAADMPLFQVQPVPRKSYAMENLKSFEQIELFDPDSGSANLTDAEWSGYRKTIRTAQPVDDMHALGQYGASTRKRAKKNE